MERIIARDNDKIKRYRKLLTGKKSRDEMGLFVIEGIKLFEEAIRSDVQMEQVFITEHFLERQEEKGIRLTKDIPYVAVISEAVETKISTSPSPQGIYAVCKKLDKPLNLGKIDNNGKFIGLWSLQDPGNVGTIFRAADAMGLSGVVLSEDCCDIYNLKTIRSAMGSLFRIPFLVTNLAEFLQENQSQMQSYAAVLDKDVVSVQDTSFAQNSMVVIGNEGNGLLAEQAACCKSKLTIPMPGSAESLNAAMAATIVMWEMSKFSK